jgi:hypothetical protein
MPPRRRFDARYSTRFRTIPNVAARAARSAQVKSRLSSIFKKVRLGVRAARNLKSGGRSYRWGKGLNYIARKQLQYLHQKYWKKYRMNKK